MENKIKEQNIMGCWNETCAISKMSIRSGDDVRFLPIVQNPYHIDKVTGYPVKDGQEIPVALKGESGCYISDFWVPLCYPIRGEYNDYGSITEIPDTTEIDIAEVNQFVRAFEENCVKLDIGENSCHDIAIKSFTLPTILGALQEGRCYKHYESSLPNRPARLVPIGWMMIKEDVWQSLLEIDIKKSGEIWSQKGEKDRHSLKGIREGIVETIEQSKKSEEISKIDPKTATTDEVKKILEMMVIMADYIGMSRQRSRVWNMAFIDGPKISTELVDVASEMEYIYSMMSILRISFQPTTGSGSQCDNYRLWNLVNKKWSKIIKIIDDERKAEQKKYREDEKVWAAKETAKNAAKKKDDNSFTIVDGVKIYDSDNLK